VMHP